MIYCIQAYMSYEQYDAMDKVCKSNHDAKQYYQGIIMQKNYFTNYL
jgi:hypothetical protein